MRALFRVDASIIIGSGHVMRCITLAKRLMESGIECIFVSREHAGNLFSTIIDNNIKLESLPACNKQGNTNSIHMKHEHWLGCTVKQDADESIEFIIKHKPDFIVVDHYAIDEEWELSIRKHYNGILTVIDDLYDRRHNCDILIDQNFGRQVSDYAKLVNSNCVLLIGCRYAIIRGEFLQQIDFANKRRLAFEGVKQVLITMGGVDQYNYTGKFFGFLSRLNLSPLCEVVIVVGKVFPHLDSLTIQVQQCNIASRIIVNAGNMAELMATSDIAIGAIGSTTWERCTMSLPTINVSIAENQLKIAATLQKIGMLVLQGEDSTFEEFFEAWHELENDYYNQIKIASNICDGKGLERVFEQIMGSIQ